MSDDLTFDLQEKGQKMRVLSNEEYFETRENATLTTAEIKADLRKAILAKMVEYKREIMADRARQAATLAKRKKIQDDQYGVNCSGVNFNPEAGTVRGKQ